MPFPTHYVVLRTLASVDFMAALALAETCSTLRHMVRHEVLNISLLCRFLRENQYALHHDIFHNYFSNKERALLHRAYSIISHRHKVEYPDPLFDENFLFCKRYMDDLNRGYSVIYISKVHSSTVRDVVNTIKNRFGSGLLFKRTLQATLEMKSFGGVELLSKEEFLSLFQMDGWMEMWTPAELGWWFAIVLSRYGPEGLETFIDQTYTIKREAVVWILLGAHDWGVQDSFDNVCCMSSCTGNKGGEYLIRLIKSLSKGDRVWALEQIVRLEPEFGVCRNLGATLYNYVVKRDPSEEGQLNLTLEKEISSSRLQDRFRYSIADYLSLAAKE
jgi:hypothetical protein